MRVYRGQCAQGAVCVEGSACVQGAVCAGGSEALRASAGGSAGIRDGDFLGITALL